MRVWLLQGKQGDEPGGLGPPLREWAARPGNAHWRVDVCAPHPGLKAEVQAQQPEVLVLEEDLCPAGPWVEELLGLGVALVVVTAKDRHEPYRALAERYPIHLLAPPPGPDGLGLAVLSAHASRHRLMTWKAQAEQLQQRLNDRIIIERAKGILVQRLGISEEEAYKRLRVLSRRQRRQIRDIAQSLLDTQSLLVPGDNGLLDLPAKAPEKVEERSKTEPPASS
jgi:AmiR/NasT family two-component response regulator